MKTKTLIKKPYIFLVLEKNNTHLYFITTKINFVDRWFKYRKKERQVWYFCTNKEIPLLLIRMFQGFEREVPCFKVMKRTIREIDNFHKYLNLPHYFEWMSIYSQRKHKHKFYL